ncbi:helix-turn-helix domain-containing protein [Sorangium sp. So ce1014]|uniref:helix-turn-helix domain-containing protein n=1 Tax=Sorangium sp. So ce1014 TaxID=3133326 RepID=UPI003F5E36B6
MISSQQLGERLTDARKRAKLTQAQVAERLGLARTTLVAIEKGERRPSNTELMRLSEMLAVSVHDLLREGYVRTELSPRFRVSSVDRNAAMIVESVERLRFFGSRYVELERLHELRRTRAPLETLQTYRVDAAGGFGLDPRLEGEDAARAVRGMLGLGDDAAMALDDRFEVEAGLRIFYLDRLPPKLSAFLIWSDDIGACVAINRAHPIERQRWSLVHEVGHFLRDREAGDVLEEDDPLKQPDEIFPEAFAREFLLPATGVQKRFAERCRAGKFTPVDLSDMAQAFGVSFQAMALRLEELRLLPRGSYERILQSRLRPRELRDRSGAVKVQASRELGLPKRYVDLAVAAYDQELLSESEFAEFLATDLVTARAIYQDRGRIRLEDGTQLPVDFSGADLRTA